MSKQSLEHKMKCRECGNEFDCRNLDEVVFHCGDHTPAPDIQYSGSKCVKKGEANKKDE